MPIAAPTAKVMATIWNGGIGRPGPTASPARPTARWRRGPPPSPGAARRGNCHRRRIDNPVACVDRAGYAVTMTADGMFLRPTNPVSHRLARLAFFIGLRGGVDRRGRGAAASLSRSRSRSRTDPSSATASMSPSPAIALALATIVPTRPGDRRRGFVAAAAGAGDRRGRRLGAGAAGSCGAQPRRASTTSRPTPPMRRRWS